MMICFIPTLTSHRNDFVSVVKFPLIYSLFSCICDFQPFSSHGTFVLESEEHESLNWMFFKK